MSNKAPAIRFKGFTHLPAGRQALGKWYVYVLLCEDSSLYKGHTQDVEKRFSQHLNGQGAEHTKKHKPIKIVYSEECETREIAIQREKYMKSGSGREWLKKHLN